MANNEIGTCIEALSKYPDLIQAVFSEKYSKKHGFYILNYFEKGYWKEIIIDDKVPV